MIDVEEKQKKPIYKRVWFWLVIVFIAIPIGGKAINFVSDATSKPGQPMINEEHMAEQARIYEELQKEEQEALEAIESGEMTYADLTDRVLASVEALVSDTFRGEHYSCTVEPYEDDFGYAATLTLDVPESYADDPDTILSGLGKTIATQSDSALVWLNIIGYYDGEIIYEESGDFQQKLYLENGKIQSTPENQSNTSSSESYVLNTNTKVFHRRTCGYVDEIASENKSYYSGSRTGAINEGYSPCGKCNP